MSKEVLDMLKRKSTWFDHFEFNAICDDRFAELELEIIKLCDAAETRGYQNGVNDMARKL